MNISNIDMDEKEKKVFCFLYKRPNTIVSRIGGRYATQGIYRNEIPKIIDSLERKNLLFCNTTRKLDVKNAWKYQARGKAPYKEEKTCKLSALGSRLAREKCR